MCGALGVACQSQAPASSLGDAERVVVAPLNLALRLPPELEDGVRPVRDEIIRYLQERDARVAVIWPSDAWELWRESMLAAGSESCKAEAISWLDNCS